MKTSGDTTGARGTSRVPRLDWRTQAACRDFVTTHYDPWEAGPKDRKPSHTAEVVCSTCPVKRECLLAGIASDAMNHHGVAYHVFGGLAPAQRRAITSARHANGVPRLQGRTADFASRGKLPDRARAVGSHGSGATANR